MSTKKKYFECVLDSLVKTKTSPVLVATQGICFQLYFSVSPLYYKTFLKHANSVLKKFENYSGDPEYPIALDGCSAVETQKNNILCLWNSNSVYGSLNYCFLDALIDWYGQRLMECK